MPVKPALQSFIEGFVGGRFTVTLTNVTVTTTASRIVQNNFERMALTIINTGANNLSVLPTPTVTTVMGVLLGASGGNVSIEPQEDLALVGFDWWAVAASGTTTVTVVEVIRYTEQPQ